MYPMNREPNFICNEYKLIVVTATCQNNECNDIIIMRVKKFEVSAVYTPLSPIYVYFHEFCKVISERLLLRFALSIVWKTQ